jgi:hypothetical protein
MKRRRIKLVWGAAKVIRGRWYFGLFGLYDRAEGMREDGIAISVRGVLVWSLAALFAVYVAATAALWSFWQRNPYCLLTYADAFLYPVRRGEVAQKKGRAFIAEGQELVKANKWLEGSPLLRHGLTLYPADLPARQALAKFNVMANQRTQAVKLLSDGLTNEFPGRTYLQSLFDLAEQGDDHALVVATADRFLPGLSGSAQAVERRWLAGRKFAALVAAERFADALVAAKGEEPGEMASEHQVLALVGLGRAAEAVALLAEWQRLPGADARTVRRLQVRAYREAGRLDEMEQALGELRALTPSDPRQSVYGIIQRALAGRDEAARAAQEDFLFRFAGSAENLRMLAEPLVEIGNLGLFERCYGAARERGYALQAFRVLRVQLHLQRGEWVEAVNGLGEAKAAASKTPTGAEQFWFEWTGRLLEAAGGPAEAAQTSLVEFLRGRPWPITVFRKSIETLRRGGRKETARDVVAVAEGLFPGSRWIQEQKAALAKELGAKQLAAMAAPMAGSAAQPATERRFFEQLDGSVAARDWAAGEKLIRELRGLRPQPAWLDKRDADLRLAEVRINQGRGETPAMLASTRLYLNGDAERAQRMLAIAKEFYAAGDQAGAQAAVQAILQRTPEFAQATALLKEWKATSAAKK